MWVFFIDAPYQVTFCSFACFYFSYHESTLNFVKTFVCNYWDDCVEFDLYSINVILHWYLDVKSILHFWAISNFLCVIFSLLVICLSLWQCVFMRGNDLWFCSDIFVWFCYLSNPGHLQWTENCPILFDFLEDFVKGWHNFSLNIW